MSANNSRKSGFLGYDLFKLIVAIALLIILILLLLRGCSGTTLVAGATPEATSAQTETSQPTEAEASQATKSGTDTESPIASVITLPRNGDTLAGASIKISGTAQPGSSVEVFDNDKSIGIAKTNGNGKWILQVPITPGEHTFVAVVNTDGGSLKSEPVSVTISLTPTPIPSATPIPPTSTPAVASNGSNCDGLISGYLLDEEHYVIGSCDTLSGIAIWLDVSIESLLESNPQITDPDTIIPGQIVNVPPG